MGSSCVACLLPESQRAHVQLLRCTLLHAKHRAEHFLMNCVLMLQATLPFVSGVSVKLLHWLLPTGKQQRKNSLEAFSLGQAERKKYILNNVSAILQRFKFSSVSLTKMKFLRSKCKATLHSPSRIVFMSRGREAQFSGFYLSKPGK